MIGTILVPVVTRPLCGWVPEGEPLTRFHLLRLVLHRFYCQDFATVPCPYMYFFLVMLTLLTSTRPIRANLFDEPFWRICIVSNHYIFWIEARKLLQGVHRSWHDVRWFRLGNEWQLDRNRASRWLTWVEIADMLGNMCRQYQQQQELVKPSKRQQGWLEFRQVFSACTSNVFLLGLNLPLGSKIKACQVRVAPQESTNRS